MSPLTVRPLRADEADLFLSLDVPPLVGVASAGRDFGEYLARGEYRPEWTWVALRDDRVVARAAWWGGPEDTAPLTLDWFDFLDPADGEALLRESPLSAEYCLFLPADWREQPDVRAAAEARAEVVGRTGMAPLVERLHYRWTGGLPERPTRLVYREEPDDAVVLAVLRRMVEGTLDAHTRATADKFGLDAAAQEELDFLHWMPSPREWWRLAHTPGGDLVGIIAPGRNYRAFVVGIVGVVPEQRGHGYGYDLLVESTHLLVEWGAEEIIADTDTTNTPMAAAFAKAGYPVAREMHFFE